ncbi:hypothetical protein FDUTEX481_09417 [Tolypothrix sp. PCC 7601]|nr:hypothetical protein FDUTEX481_09417 [Tolypothrix sp. PCC 7601]BAY91174.1 hypothetical protein NIES3275_31960 [Microchaete diplosiphon NIES-3275]
MGEVKKICNCQYVGGGEWGMGNGEWVMGNGEWVNNLWLLTLEQKSLPFVVQYVKLSLIKYLKSTKLLYFNCIA